MTVPQPPSQPNRSNPPSPVLAWIRRASTLTFVLVVAAVVVATVAVLVMINPGHRVGPVQPAVPAVGSGDLPAP